VSATPPRAGVAVTGWGLRCALGEDPLAVAGALAQGASGVAVQAELAELPDARAAVVAGPDLRPWLKRRKDAKLFARPSELVLPACGEALAGFGGELLEVGVYLGVGREPSDGGDSEASLVASCQDGQLDQVLLAGVGKDLYPPLLPLRTLPNMALAHVSIHLGVGGANGAWAGDAPAGLQAIRVALWALVEGRCPVALAGGTDSHVDLGSARDQRRLGQAEVPGEAAAVLRLEPLGSEGTRCTLHLVELSEGELVEARRATAAHWPALGRCGAGDAALALVLAAARVGAGGPVERLACGSPPVCFELRPA